ncbi:hypothetical protein CA13_57420 [Planctomycetes bacterium CA13]|uniref:Ice-binding protein C-terminal domain-containing protein n=2 Tax=Novipirellula herctigrandis TaxID=2527986 RepID=A0A5C5ZAV0_9BACT|nr:hypothetical protein CA13_57420 [Planctomycetes bacterium CA13]
MIQRFLTLAVIAALGISSATTVTHADVVLFDGTVVHGGLFANGMKEIDTATFPGESVIKFTPDGSYKSGGLEFYGGKEYTIPTGESLLRVSAYSTDAGNMNGFTISMDTGSFDLGTDDWTLDGNPGAIGDFTGGNWHELEFDLSTVSGFVAGTSVLNGLVTFKNNTSLNPIYIGDISLATAVAVPEPSTFAALAIVGFSGTVIARRRRRKLHSDIAA